MTCPSFVYITNTVNLLFGNHGYMIEIHFSSDIYIRIGCVPPALVLLHIFFNLNLSFVFEIKKKKKKCVRHLKPYLSYIYIYIYLTLQPAGLYRFILIRYGRNSLGYNVRGGSLNLIQPSYQNHFHQ